MATFLAFTHRTKFPCPEPAGHHSSPVILQALGPLLRGPPYRGRTANVQNLCFRDSAGIASKIT